MVRYKDQPLPEDVKKLLPQCVMGEIEKGLRKNGDFVFSTNDVRGGVLRVIRKRSPGVRK